MLVTDYCYIFPADLFIAAAVNGIKDEMKGGFIVMKKNVKRFVKHDDMAMLVAAGSLAGCGGGGRRFKESPAKAAANTGGSSGGAVTVKVSILSQAATRTSGKSSGVF